MNQYHVRSNEEIGEPSLMGKANDFPGNKDATEINPVPDNDHYVTKKKSSAISILMSSFLMLIVATLTVAPSVPTSKSNVEVLDLVISDTIVEYEMKVEGENLQIILYNDLTHRKASLQQGVNEGKFEDLKPNLPYTLEVIDNDANQQVIYKKTFKTKKTT